MNVQHTPGPWIIKGPKNQDGADDYAIVAGREIIAEAFGRSSVKTFHPSLANANLIAAAPDLLAVLSEYNLPLTGNDGSDNYEFGVFQVARELRRRAAIAKATGCVA